MQATLRFASGATGIISYLTGGNARFPKETMDVTGGGRSARLDNFREAAVWGGRGKSAAKARGGQDKGQKAEMEQFIEAVADRRPDADRPGLAARHHAGHDRGRREHGQRQTGAGVNDRKGAVVPGLSEATEGRGNVASLYLPRGCPPGPPCTAFPGGPERTGDAA